MGTNVNLKARRLGAALIVITALIAGACTSKKTAEPGPTTTGTTPTTKPAGTTAVTDPTGPAAAPGASKATTLKLKLSQGESAAGDATAVQQVDGAPLDQARIDEIFARLPEWRDDAALAEAFKFPAETLPVPRPGTTIDQQFPPADTATPPEVPTGPLEVLRHQPDGEVKIAPFFTVTFNQPMVAVGTVAQVDASTVPAKITPDVPGRWQWIGTQTLRFDATNDLVDRLPMATKFTVSIPAGTVSATGGALAQDASFEFATPPVTVLGFSPLAGGQLDNSLPLVPVFVATFDQLVDQAAVLATIKVIAGGNDVPVRLATAAEIDADDAARPMVAGAAAGRFIAFRPVDPLPADTAIDVAMGPDTPSAEGPLTTTEAATYHGRTYAPLRVVTQGCGGECPPGAGFSIQFNNPLDTTVFSASAIKISPALAGLSVGVYDVNMQVNGLTQGRTTYEVTLPAGLTDVHGQTLGQDTKVTVDIGAAQPSLGQFNQMFVTLDPLASGRTIPITSVNHDKLKLHVYSVTPADLPAYVGYLVDFQQNQSDTFQPPGFPEVLNTTIDTGGTADQTTETPIDLSKQLAGVSGHVVVVVETTEHYSRESNEWYQNRPAIAWVQATSIGLDAINDNRQLKVWATDLKTGAPLQGVTIETIGGTGTSTSTDADGITTTIDLTTTSAIAVKATNGGDVAVLSASSFGAGLWQGVPDVDSASWYVVDDRGIYKPGEQIHVKGWVRRMQNSTDGSLKLLGDGATVNFSANDGNGIQLTTGNATVNSLGGFTFDVDLPAAANLGYAYLQMSLTGTDLVNTDYTHSFQIQEFRRPEFEVTARNESPGPYLSAKPATVAVNAAYYSGGPLGAAPVKWQVTTAAGSYSPPGWDQFTFGIWTPWWIYGDYGGYRGGGYLGGDVSAPCCIPVTDGGKVEQFSGTTDAAGNHYLKIDFGSVDGEFPDLPVTVSAQATVTDVNRQAWSSTTNVLVHPGEFYVGLRSDRTFVKQGDPLNIEAVVTDIDGKIAAGRPVKVLAERLGYTFENGTWDQRVVADESCDITSGTEAATCTFATAEGGEYRITATIADDHGGRSRTQLTRWVSGGDAVPTRGVEQQQATIIPDKASYAPGDTAELLVQAPFAGQGLMTLTHHGIISTSRFEVVGGSAVLTVPIDDALVPNVDVNIEVVGITPRTADNGAPLPDAPPRPAYAVGQLSLRVEPTTRTLAVTATPADPELTPGTSTKVDVTVKDPAGAPVQGAEFAIVVVDEAVLALTNYGLPSPLDVFYQQNPTYLNAQYGRAGIVLANPAALTGEAQAIPSSEAPAATDAASAVFDAPALTVAAATTAAPSAAASESQKASAPADRLAATSGGADASNAAIDVRTNFDALAVFQPSVTTDANGAATVDVPLPDNLTRYRVMVVAASGDNLFGSAQSNITARLPLGVRPSAPRFLNFGDAFELPVVLQNQTDAAMDVDVALQAANLAITGAAGKHVSIPANDRIEVRFPVLASQAGTARFRVAAVSTAGDADAATVELPVYTPATTEAFATYGVIDDGAAAQPLLAPTGVVPQFGGLDVTTSSTALAGLTDAVIYISNYPYESSDAWASQIMSIASLKDVLAAFDAPGVSSPEALNAAVEDAIGHLVALQNDDGGFGFWERYRPSEPYNTVQVAHALVLAKKAGYTVPDQMLGRVMDYVRNVENYYPAAWGDDIRDFVSAYAINVRTQNDDRDVAKAQDLWNRRGDKLQLDTVALLWPSIDDQATDAAIEKLFNNRAVDTAGAAHFTTSYGDGASQILNSDRRTDGMILDSLVSKRPTSDLIPKVVTGLLDHRTAGRWDNIQENAFILLALKKYFDTFEKVTPDFVARVWLGDRYAGAGTFQGRSTDRANISIPTSELVTTGNTSLVLGKEGTGRLYYRIGLRYAPESLHLDPLDRGFVVERTYEGADDPADVTRDPDGTWRIKAGARVRVRLTMVAESQRAHVALVDHLPAGLEILNPALATTPALPPDSQGGVESTANGAAIDAPFFSEDSFWWYGTWFDHQNLRDDRAEAFSALLPAGTYDYSYVAKATTPGTFIAPPTKAEEIYAPETFGRTSTSKVIVTP